MAKPHLLTVTIKENSKKNGTFSLPIISGATEGELQAIITALDALVVGTILSATRSVVVPLPATVAGKVSDVPPSDAQRGHKFEFSGIDDNGYSHYFTVPCVDLDEVTQGDDDLDLADTEIAAFVSAVEAVWCDRKDDTVTNTVDGGEYVNKPV